MRDKIVIKEKVPIKLQRPPVKKKKRIINKFEEEKNG